MNYSTLGVASNMDIYFPTWIIHCVSCWSQTVGRRRRRTSRWEGGRQKENAEGGEEEEESWWHCQGGVWELSKRDLFQARQVWDHCFHVLAAVIFWIVLTETIKDCSEYDQNQYWAKAANSTLYILFLCATEFEYCPKTNKTHLVGTMLQWQWSIQTHTLCRLNPTLCTEYCYLKYSVGHEMYINPQLKIVSENSICYCLSIVWKKKNYCVWLF